MKSIFIFKNLLFHMLILLTHQLQNLQNPLHNPQICRMKVVLHDVQHNQQFIYLDIILLIDYFWQWNLRKQSKCERKRRHLQHLFRILTFIAWLFVFMLFIVNYVSSHIWWKFQGEENRMYLPTSACVFCNSWFSNL